MRLNRSANEYTLWRPLYMQNISSSECYLWYSVLLMTCTAPKVLWPFNFLKSQFSVKRDLKISRLSEWGSEKKSPKAKTREFFWMFPALPQGSPIPAAPKAYMASCFISSWVGIAGSSLPLRAIQWGLVGWAQIKGRGTQWSIGHRNVLENQRIQQAFRQTALLLYFCSS